jgi:hypothetical protein
VSITSLKAVITPRNRKQRTMPLETLTPTTELRVFPPRRDYSSLSVKDLLDAREAYHVHFSMLENVVATAIGRYYIHEKDWYAENPPGKPRPNSYPQLKEPRTLANSVIRPWSWPAVLVFVKRWEERRDLGDQAIPRTLYLSDGRSVPTCVIEMSVDESLPRPSLGPFQTSKLLGGGYSCRRFHQGEQAVGTFACLVRKGGSYYALTNRHVAGGDGEVVSASIRGEYEPIGKTSDMAVDKQPMSTIFPAWADSHVLLTLDAGLIHVENINDWTSQTFGIGEIGEVFDATERSITLDLIGCPVRAFGGSTGVSEGEIRALFFRHASLGGYEYATDVLIGPRKEKGKDEHPVTNPGDSGTLWFYDPAAKAPAEVDQELDITQPIIEPGERARRLRPLAMQWGGQRVRLPNGTPSAYALGTFLSSICRVLDVEVVRDWSIGHDEYWGKIGHFAIGWKACDRLSGALGDLMRRNQDRIGFADKRLTQGSEFRVGRDGFVPLADVPDYVWIAARGTHPNEGIQHFADIDIPDIDGGPSLLEQCVADPRNVAASKWKAYFNGFAEQGVGPEDGALPFRVWQIWDAMVAYLRKADILRFVAAAGVLAHYIGDASQPLHCSYLHHGVPPKRKVNGREYPVPRDSADFDAFKKSRAAKIHGIYEEMMLEVDPASALEKVDQVLGGRERRIQIKDGHGAAVATIHLMNAAQKRLSPDTIISADDASLGPKARAKRLWENSDIREATAQSLADSVRVVTGLWSSAWIIGRGARIPKSKLIAFDEDDLDRVYRRESRFVPSMSLTAMVESGRFEP